MNRDKIAYKKYSYYKKTDNGFELLKDWNAEFKNYYYKALVADKKYKQHMLRHTFATRCIECGVDYKALSDIHSTMQISQLRLIHTVM